jgi:predicted transcriptional regulator
MDADQSFEDLRAEAMALRDQGTPRLEMQQALGVSAWKLTELLDGAADVDSPLRARAKPQLRSRAQELRASGRSYREIAKELGVSKSSVSLWLRHAPYPGPEAEVSRQRRLVGMRDYWDEERRTREAVRRVVVEQAFGEIGELSDREVLIAGAVAYWCEGAKSKPYRKDALPTLLAHRWHRARASPISRAHPRSG